MGKKKKQQYGLEENSSRVRYPILLPRKDFERLENWRKLTGRPKSNLVLDAISEKLDKEEIRLKIKLE